MSAGRDPSCKAAVAEGVHRLTEIYARANQNLTQLLESWTPSQVSTLIHFLTDASDIANTFADQLGQESASSDSPHQ